LPTRIQSYVLFRALVGICAALVVVSSIVVLIDFVELSRTIGGRVELGFAQLMALTLLKSPSVIVQLLPFAFLFGVMGAFVVLNRQSELVAMRAAGVSAWRFILPTAVVAFAVGLLTISILGPFASDLNGRFEDRSAELMGGLTRDQAREVWLRQGDDQSQIVIHARIHDIVGQTVRLTGVSLFIQTVAPRGEVDFSRRIDAAQAILTPGYWRLTNVREALPGSGSVRSEQLSIASSLDRRTAMEKFASPSTITLWRLPATIHSAELAGYSAAMYKLRLEQLLATPLMFSAMAILAAAFSLRLMRLGGLAQLAGSGVALGFVIFFSNQFCGALGGTEVLPAFIAAWATPVLALLSGVTLLCYTEDG
jgi:lipopolysaccharide export system permease protein